MFYREAGQYKTNYAADMAVFPLRQDRIGIAVILGIALIGIPLIVFSLGVLLSRPTFHVGDLALTPAWIVWAAAAVWYLTRGNLILGLAVSLGTALLMLMAGLLPRSSAESSSISGSTGVESAIASASESVTTTRSLSWRTTGSRPRIV